MYNYCALKQCLSTVPFFAAGDVEFSHNLGQVPLLCCFIVQCRLHFTLSLAREIITIPTALEGSHGMGHFKFLCCDQLPLMQEKNFPQKGAVLLEVSWNMRLRLWKMWVSFSLAWNPERKPGDIYYKWAGINNSFAAEWQRHWAQCRSQSRKKSDKWAPLEECETGWWTPCTKWVMRDWMMMLSSSCKSSTI